MSFVGVHFDSVPRHLMELVPAYLDSAFDAAEALAVAVVPVAVAVAAGAG